MASESEPTDDVGPALFRFFPELDAKLPFLPLATRPSPVAELARLSNRAGSGPIWVKRDDRLSSRYGGNKIRKLEWILGDARTRGAERLLTVGVVGSNHVLATAVHGADAGFEVAAVQMPAPLSERARRTARAAEAAGLEIHWAADMAAIPFVLAVQRLRARFGLVEKKPEQTYWIAGGGSSPIGTIGFVDAALELAEQVRNKELPEPAAIVVAGGTGGTHAGLMVGCRLGGLNTRVIGVRVVSRLIANRRAIARLANSTLALLRRAGLPRLVGSVSAGEITLLHSAFGAGYAKETRGGLEAVAVARELEHLSLEPVYTGKALSGLLSLVLDDPEVRRGPLLFWNTAAAPGLEHLLRGAGARRTDVPYGYRSFLRRRSQFGRARRG